MNATSATARWRLSSVLAIPLAFLVAACAPAAAHPPPPPPPAPAPAPTPTPSGPLLKVTKDAKLGNILAGPDGRVVYLLTRDERNKSTYTGQNWLPLTGEKLGAGEGVAAALSGAATRPDGSKSVSYNGWPLYYYVRDEKPGDTNGQNTGGVYFVVSPEGAPIQTNALVKSAKNPLGTVLTDASGRTVYLFSRDEKAKSSCDRDCRQAWPPLLTVGDPKAGEGVTVAQLSALKRDNGTEQVTYNGLPLYYFTGDEKPGDITGQNVASFGGNWFVLSTAGEAIKAPAAPGAGAPQPAGGYGY